MGGMRAAEARLDRAAEIAATEFSPERVSLSNGDALVEATVERISAATAFRANLKLLQSADQMSNDLMELITRR
jgi:flagellar basal body rod protein FlgC